MAYYPKYNKKKKSKKAFAGAATAALGLGKMAYGAIQSGRARKAEKAFDQDRLKMGVSQATQQMADEAIDQSLIEKSDDISSSDYATSISALSKDPRNLLAGVNILDRQKKKKDIDLLNLREDAKRRGLYNLAQEQRSVEGQRLAVAGQEIEGIRGEKAAGVQNIFGGAEDTLSGVASMASGMPIGKDGAKIEAEEGGVTPGEFDHKDNPIDMVQDGEKIGEATGGELILPPDDVEAVRSALQEGDKDAAFKLMEELVAKYDENVIGDDDNQDMAQEGGKVTEPTTPPLDMARAQEIEKAMKASSKEVRNLGELPFDEDPTNPAGLVNFMNNRLSFDIDSTNKAEIDFIRKYRDFMVKEEGRTDAPKMMAGGYLAKVKARMGAYMKSKY
tara:strand:- start:474 stop:1640 length:1167 start_codon:yes stop_codon:yes gene_type:complete